jgi:hypothetical protein
MYMDKEATMQSHGLRQRIAIANSHEEIDALLEEGKNYKDAAQRTKDKWLRTAEARKQTLNSIPEPAEKPKKKRGKSKTDQAATR